MEMTVFCTREQAIKNGSLVDVTKEAKEFGIKYPIAITKNLYNVLLGHYGKDTYNKLSGILFGLWFRLGDTEDYQLSFETTIGNGTMSLMCVCDEEINGNVLTLMLSSERKEQKNDYSRV